MADHPPLDAATLRGMEVSTWRTTAGDLDVLRSLRDLAGGRRAYGATASVSGELLGDLSEELRGRFADDGPVQLLTPWLTL
jgi:hypothetical protein